MKRKLIAAGVVAVSIAVGGVAWAMLGGVVTVPAVVQGIISGPGAGGCQTQAVNFTLPAPSWSNTIGDYAISTIDYSGISTACVNLGTADLLLTLTPSGQPNPIGSATSSNMGTPSGSLSFSAPIAFDTAANADFYYIVKDS